MEVRDLREEVRKLESDIKDNLIKLVRDFAKKTLCSPSNINIELIEITNMSDTNPKFHIGRVNVDIKI